MNPSVSVSLRPLALLACAAGLFAQAPAPIDNDQVQVVKAIDKPHSPSQPHEHKTNRVMIYLTAGRQTITPQGGKTTTIDVKAGDVRWSPASGMHVSEVVSNTPLSMVEVLLKNTGAPGKVAKTPLDVLSAAPDKYKLLFENDQVRVIRVKVGAGQKVPLHEHTLNRVVVYLTDQDAVMTNADGSTTPAKHKAGEASWGGPAKHTEQNLMGTPFEAVMVELKR